MVTIRSLAYAEYPAGTHWTPGEVRAVELPAGQALPDGFELAEFEPPDKPDKPDKPADEP